MFRASLRSVKDPLREHVCASCLTRRFGGNGRLRQFSGSAAFRAESGGDAPAADSQGPENGSLTGSAIPKQVCYVPQLIHLGNECTEGNMLTGFGFEA